MNFRCFIFGALVFIGEFSCFATYWTRTYTELFVCRILTGISIGGATPVVFSLLADLYSGSKRTSVSTWVGMSMSVGIAFGQLLAGLLGTSYGWRIPFLIVSIPALLCGVLIISTTEEPERGAQEEEMLLMRANLQFKHPSNNEHPTKINLREESLHLSSSFKINPLHTISIEEKNNHEESPIEYSHDLFADLSPFGHRDELSSQKSNLLPSLRPRLYSTELKDASELSENEKSNVGCEEECFPLPQSLNIQQFLHPEINAVVTRPNALEFGSCQLGLEADYHYKESLSCHKIYLLLHTPSVVIILLQGIPGCLPWGLIYTFLNDYFSSERGLSVFLATVALTLFGVGSLFGQVFGGILGQYLHNKNRIWQYILMGISTILSVLPLMYLVNTKTPGDFIFFMMSLFAGFIVNLNGPNIRAVLQVILMFYC